MTTKPEQPTLIVEWPACPSCGHNAGRETYRTETSRTIIGHYRRAYARCRSCGHRVVIEHQPVWK